MAVGSTTTVTAEQLFRTWQQSAGQLSELHRERLMAFDQRLARVQQYPTRHGGAGWALTEVAEGLKHLKELGKRMPGLVPGLESYLLKMPGVHASRAVIDATVRQTGVVREAVQLLAQAR